ncbi:MAG: HlyC/CorC family transporter [Planctomycetia bacterium]|nr:HlyC/CorC family transporter [Planctomycetia bacterium]
MTLAALGLETAVALLVVASVAAVQARAVRGARRHRLLELCRDRGRPERYDEIVEASETIAFIAASVVAIAAVGATLLASRSLGDITGGRLAFDLPALVGWVMLVWAMLVVVPMLVTKLAGAAIVVATWGVWRPIVRLASPAVRGLAVAAGSLGRLIGRADVEPTGAAAQEELRLVVDEAHREGRLEGVARDMIAGVIDLKESRVGQIMTGRTAVVSIPIATPWEEAVRLAAESGHTRLPVWERSPDDVIGILHTRELLTQLVDGLPAAEARDLRPLLRPPWFVPETMSVQKLLREFQRTHTHMAIVTDEFGGVSGLVTIEDALEEIVGEIVDEHDDALTDGVRMVSPDVCEAKAQVRIAEINAMMGVTLPEEADFETIGGFVFHQCGRIPEVGRRIESHGVAVEVLAATGRRIDRVRIERVR